MDLRQEPTLIDVAQLLDTIRAGAEGKGLRSSRARALG